MKLKIPSECQLGAIKFKIKRNEKLLELLNVCGYISTKEQTIWLAHRKPENELVILLHEIFHDILRRRIDRCAEDDEYLVEALAHELVIFMLSLGIEPDFTNIPEEREKYDEAET